MSLKPNFTANPHIMILQKDMGFTGKDLDGKRGNDTMSRLMVLADAGRLQVIPEMVIEKEPDLPDVLREHDIPKLGVGKLSGVNPLLVEIIIEASIRSVTPFTVIEGVRSLARQRELVAAKASKTMNSKHLTGDAVDLWPLDPATMRTLPSDAEFKNDKAAARAASDRLWADLRKISVIVKEVAKEKGARLTWGGDWGWDAPHFQLDK